MSVFVDFDAASCSPGERISGAVRLRPSRTQHLTAIKLELGWRTRGEGNEARRIVDTQSIPVGRDLTELDELSERFEFVAPDGPPSHQYPRFAVQWFVRATAELRLALDPAVEEVFELRSGAVPYSAAPRHKPVDTRSAVGCRGITMSLLMAAVPLAFGLGAFASVSGGRSSTSDEVGAILFGSICSLIGVALILVLILNIVSAASLGHPVVHIEPVTVVQGCPVKVMVTLQPKRPIVVTAGTLRLVATERVVSGSGKSKRTIMNEVDEYDTVLLTEPVRVGAGESVDLWGEVQLSEDVPPSLEAPDNALRWAARLELKIDGAPDWRSAVPLVVASRAPQV